MPFLELRVQTMNPVIDDGLNGGGFLTTPAAWTADAAFHKSLKRYLLAGVAAVARELTTRDTDVLVGFGQGAVIAYLLTLPRLVEFALAARHAQPSDGVGAVLSMAWPAGSRDQSAPSHPGHSLFSAPQCVTRGLCSTGPGRRTC